MLLEQARVVLEDTSAFYDLASRAKLGVSTTLRIAMAPGLCEVVNRIRLHLGARVPHMAIEGTDMSSSGQYQALRRRSVDVGLLRHVPDDPNIESAPLFAEHFVVMVSESSPFAHRRSVKLKQLAGERLLLQDRDWAALAHDKIFSLYAAAGLTPSVATLQATPGNQASMLSVAAGEAHLSRAGRPHQPQLSAAQRRRRRAARRTGRGGPRADRLEEGRSVAARLRVPARRSRSVFAGGRRADTSSAARQGRGPLALNGPGSGRRLRTAPAPCSGQNWKNSA